MAQLNIESNKDKILYTIEVFNKIKSKEIDLENESVKIMDKIILSSKNYNFPKDAIKTEYYAFAYLKLLEYDIILLHMRGNKLNAQIDKSIKELKAQL